MLPKPPPPPRHTLWQGGGCELTSMYSWPRPKHSQQPPGVVQNWSALQCTKEKHSTMW